MPVIPRRSLVQATLFNPDLQTPSSIIIQDAVVLRHRPVPGRSRRGCSSPYDYEYDETEGGDRFELYLDRLRLASRMCYELELLIQ